MKLKDAVKVQWLAALRGGEYLQGQHRLTTFNDPGGKRFDCCLGVLTDLAVKDGLDLPYTDEDTGEGYGMVRRYQIAEGVMEDSLLPPQVVAWAMDPATIPGMVREVLANPLTGVDVTVLTADSDGQEYQQSLADVNDEGGSFRKIAALIDKHM